MLAIFKKEIAAPLVSNVADKLRDGNDLLSNDTIVLNERLDANLFCRGDITIGSDGILSGDIISEVCISSGTIQGNISAIQKLDVKSSAIINGNIQAPVLNIEEGAVINGRVTVKQENAAIRVDLMNKLNRHSADDFLSAKARDISANAPVVQRSVEAKPDAKPSYGTLRAAEKRETAEKPQIVQKELSAAAPQPKVVENTEVNNRWW